MSNSDSINMSSNAENDHALFYNDNSSLPPPSNQVTSSSEQTLSQCLLNSVFLSLEVRFNHVHFDRKNYRAFRLWWDRTLYGQQVKAGDPDFPDPGWESANRRSSAWDFSIEAADSMGRRPCIFCCWCERLLKHPLKNDTTAGNL